MKNKPFIKLFKTPYRYYVYDVNTNAIISVSEETYENLNKFLKNDNPNENLYNEEILYLQEQGYLKSIRPEIIEMPETDNMEYYLRYRLERILLQITHHCNFRCRYCHYTYGDDKLFHSHKPKSMRWETAKGAIDFLADRSRDAKYINIGFYGGEPLLEYNLIKKCIEYGNKVFEGKILSYSMTTNGSLLTVEHAKYLLENNVSIMVSLDGPKEIHDKNRKLAKDGSGTFDLVHDNLRKIKKELPYYYPNISINSVVDPSLDCSLINNFFEKDLFEQLPINTSPLDPTLGKGLYLSENYIKDAKKSILLAMLSKVGVIDEEDLPLMAFNNKKNLESFEEKLTRFSEIPRIMGHSGPCKPGIFRLFVSIDGELYPCERLKDSSEVMKIGSLKEGLDIKKVKYLYNVGYVNAERCKNCWNIRHCNICASKINDGQCLSEELCAYECKSSIRETEDKLRQLAAISEVKNIVSSTIYKGKV